LTPQQLRLLLQEAHQAGRMTPALAEVFLKIAKGYFSRHGASYKFLSVDDFSQEAIVQLLEKYKKVDPNKNPFCYLTRHCQYVLMEMTNRHAKEEKFLDDLKQRAYN
jgi:hypothetical protein